VFDVLVYLYENYGALNACPDADALSQKLASAGFEQDEITQALSWLQGLVRSTKEVAALRDPCADSFRVFAGFETRRLEPEAIGFLAFLEAAGQLSSAQREIVLERALALAESPVPLAKFKVIVLMVLWSQQADIDILILEELLDDGEQRRLH
jgi:Smg protein